MRKEAIDTDSLLDLCSCGAHAKFVYDDSQSHPWWVQCTECAEAINPQFRQSQAMTEWTIRRRDCHSAILFSFIRSDIRK
jgi:hypothetical protein